MNNEINEILEYLFLDLPEKDRDRAVMDLFKDLFNPDLDSWEKELLTRERPDVTLYDLAMQDGETFITQHKELILRTKLAWRTAGACASLGVFNTQPRDQNEKPSLRCGYWLGAFAAVKLLGEPAN
uniref:Uncharacterized protein n=1 Tax=Lobelia fervens subsp. fervens TaxID=2041125 RepID=A0A291EXI9_9ASTR|nr:hypothetical protein Lo_fe_fe1Pt0340 [Lobelia fervens subsp. fervens]